MAGVKPDWHAAGKMVGGKLSEVPQPHVWRWPNAHGVRRDVKCEVSTWRGVSMGAVHYYAEVKVEPNQVWNIAEQIWQVPARASFSSDRVVKFKAEVLTRSEAVAFIRVVLDTYFTAQRKYRICGKYGTTGRAAVLREVARD